MGIFRDILTTIISVQLRGKRMVDFKCNLMLKSMEIVNTLAMYQKTNVNQFDMLIKVLVKVSDGLVP